MRWAIVHCVIAREGVGQRSLERLRSIPRNSTTWESDMGVYLSWRWVTMLAPKLAYAWDSGQ